MESLPVVDHWPTFQTLCRLLLALTLGLFIGLEREWRGKEAGLRTFGLSALLGALGGIMGQSYGLLSVGILTIPIVFLNLQSLRQNQGAELTTSVALLITGFSGVLCGIGQVATPSAVVVITAGLLAWKERLAGFSHKLTAEELRSAILLGIFTFAVYPVLPTSPIDPWGLIVPRSVWMTVILIASIGFVNYLLWKAVGNRSLELTGFFGGLVNSSVAVAEIATRVKATQQQLTQAGYRAVLWSTAAMAFRNAIVLGVLGPKALAASILPLTLMVASCLAFVIDWRPSSENLKREDLRLPLTSPFSLSSAFKFGLVFLMLEIIGTFAHNWLGHGGFYVVSFLGGFISSASSVASAGALCASGKITAMVAGIGTVLASLASAGINLILAARFSQNQKMTAQLSRALGIVLIVAIAGTLLQWKMDIFLR